MGRGEEKKGRVRGRDMEEGGMERERKRGGRREGKGERGGRERLTRLASRWYELGRCPQL